jgi:Tfp pilus assembly protein PilO
MFADWVWVQNVVFPLIGMAMGSFVLFGAYRTVNRVLDRRHEAKQLSDSGELRAEVRRLEDRVAVLEDGAQRVQELEERLDFAERMLAKQGQRPLLGDH